MVEVEVNDRNGYLPNYLFNLNFYPSWKVGDCISFGGILRQIDYIHVEVKSPDIHFERAEIATIKMDISTI